jgi:hypothetical protein
MKQLCLKKDTKGNENCIMLNILSMCHSRPGLALRSRAGLSGIFLNDSGLRRELSRTTSQKDFGQAEMTEKSGVFSGEDFSRRKGLRNA